MSDELRYEVEVQRQPYGTGHRWHYKVFCLPGGKGKRYEVSPVESYAPTEEDAVRAAQEIATTHRAELKAAENPVKVVELS